MKLFAFFVPVVHLIYTLFVAVDSDIVVSPQSMFTNPVSVSESVASGTFRVLMKNGSDGVSVEQLIFRRAVAESVIIDLLIIALIVVVILLVKERRKKVIQEDPVFVPYERCEIVHSPQIDARSDFHRLKQFLAVEYKNCAISLEFVESSLKLPQHRIRALLRDSLQVNFKQYVTELRMAEAKRLLLSADYRIQDVAQAVGYLHTTTFNHVFKEYTGITPRLFRSENGVVTSSLEISQGMVPKLVG